MKFKSIYLGMLGAAALVSCNNEIIENEGGGNKPADKVQGTPTFATIRFSQIGDGSGVTYAGETTQTAEAAEKNIANAVLMVYSWDGANMTPESYAYVTSAPASNKITLKTTSGQKKLFLACNVGTGTKTLIKGIGTSATTTDEGDTWSTTYDDMNQILYTDNTTNGFSTTGPVAGVSEADGLIMALAGGAGTIGNGKINTSTAYTGNEQFLMTNWDGVSDTITGSSPDYESTCLFTMTGDVSAAASKAGTLATDNAFKINVQRAVAKIGVKISATKTGTAYNAGSGGNAGSFVPLTPAGSTNGVWSLGNIHKEAKPFQTYASGLVQDHNFQQTDDSLANAAHFTKWKERYDNTRVFGTTFTKYPDPTNITVANTMTAMQTAGNYVELNDGGTTNWDDRKYAFTTENARAYTVMHDHGAYICIAGTYTPTRWLYRIKRAAVATNAATATYSLLDPAVAANEGYGQNVTYTNENTGDAVNYLNNDTLYYINKSGQQLFVVGLQQLKRYYAWGTPRIAPDATEANVEANAAVIAQINADKASGEIVAYNKGQCFYRVFISNSKGSTVTPPANEQNAVRRNHIYRVNITSIKGPGIADPNNILVPGQSIPVTETYVTAEVNVLDWHVVNQEAEGEGQ